MKRTIHLAKQKRMFFESVDNLRRLLPFLFALLILACNNEDGADVVTASLPPEYYFYPKANVYFDSANKEYLFIGNDGKSWEAQKQLPAAMQTLMDKTVRIENAATPVWKDNENHKIVYAALLYALPADTQPQKITRPVVIPKTGTSTNDKKPRKGLRKFIDKIFGKKNKDN